MLEMDGEDLRIVDVDIGRVVGSTLNRFITGSTLRAHRVWGCEISRLRFIETRKLFFY